MTDVINVLLESRLKDIKIVDHFRIFNQKKENVVMILADFYTFDLELDEELIEVNQVQELLEDAELFKIVKDMQEMYNNEVCFSEFLQNKLKCKIYQTFNESLPKFTSSHFDMIYL